MSKPPEKSDPHFNNGPSNDDIVENESFQERDVESTPNVEPAFLIPTAMIVLISLLAVIHLARYEGPEGWYYWSTAYFSFIPLRFDVPLVAGSSDFGVWLTPFSHAFLHGSWTHLLVNCFWMVAFATPVLRRLGPIRFFALFLGASASGALFYYGFNAVSAVPMVGASGAVSGFMGAAARFALKNIGSRRQDVHLAPAMPLMQVFTDRTTLAFIAGFAVVNAVSSTGIIQPDGSGGIAWEAHIGGFLFGLLAFSIFDPLRNAQKHR